MERSVVYLGKIITIHIQTRLVSYEKHMIPQSPTGLCFSQPKFKSTGNLVAGEGLCELFSYTQLKSGNANNHLHFSAINNPPIPLSPFQNVCLSEANGKQILRQLSLKSLFLGMVLPCRMNLSTLPNYTPVLVLKPLSNVVHRQAYCTDLFNPYTPEYLMVCRRYGTAKR